MIDTSVAIKIGNRMIGKGHPCFIVAEMSANHAQSFDKAVEIIKAAKVAGADAVKLQTYTPDTMTLDSDKEWFLVGGKNNPDSWRGRTLYGLYKTAYTPWDWQPKLKKIADELGIILFSTPFDESSVDFLEALNIPCYKVGSYEAVDIPLLKKIAKTHKPVILSIGYASREEADDAVKTLRENGAGGIAVLHCVTGYSDKPCLEDMNLRTIADIQERIGVVSGFSDNNVGIETPVMAVRAGASILEKHVILTRSDKSPDARFSLEPNELKAMVEKIREYEKTGVSSYENQDFKKALGAVHYGAINETEAYNRRFRRSIFAVSDIKKGEAFTKENIRVIRPAFGLEPKHFEAVLGKHAAKDIARGTPLSWGLVS